MFLDSLISAGANLLTGAFNRSSQEDFNRQQLQFGRDQMAQQENFAKHSLQWKIDDAASRGIHPLVALGAQGSSPSPVSVGGEAGKWPEMGQDIARAAKAMASSEERDEVDNREAKRLQLENMGLQNDILRTKIASQVNTTSRGSSQLGPAMPKGWASMVGGGPRRTAEGFAVSDDDIKSKAESSPGVNRMPLWGILPLKTYPGRATGQDMENEYGEYAGGALAAPNIISDLVYTYGPQGGFSLPGGSGSRIKRFRRGRYTAPSYRPWAE